jgi:hypothetical protein
MSNGGCPMEIPSIWQGHVPALPVGSAADFRFKPGPLFPDLISSMMTDREFCNRCGANVFWHNTGRPTIIDVSVGLLRGEGARVEGWLKWATGRVSFTELAVQKDLVGLLEKGLQEYHRSPSQAEIDKMFK